MKKLITSLFILSALLPVRADLLYFLVSGYSTEGTKYNFDYAVVGVAKNIDGTWTTGWGTGGKNVYLDIQSTPDTQSGASESSTKVVTADNSGAYSTTSPSWADVTDYRDSDYAFYIETYRYGDSDAIWGFDEATAQSYSQLASAHHIYNNSTALPNVTPWAVPEPTSGLLLLLGLAGLALRRRRRS